MNAVQPEPGDVAAATRETHRPDLADLLLDYLYDAGVRQVFGIPGGAIEPLYDALARSERAGRIRAITARHEAGAAFMADGLARETSAIGVCCGTTGPGTTNLITGVATAYVDRVPMLVITAQTSLPKFGRNALQDSSCTAINTVAMFEHCTCYNTLVSHPDQLETKLTAALMAAVREQRPAHISIPSDVLYAPQTSAPRLIQREVLLQRHHFVDLAAFERLCEEVARAKHIVLFLGDGCGGAMDDILQFAELTNAGITTGPMGKRWMNAFHPHYFGVFGYAGHRSARQLLRRPEVDLILAVGTALGELATGGWDRLLLNERLVHIDASVENFTRSPMARLHVCGHLPSLFKLLVQRVRDARSWGRVWGRGDDHWLLAAQREREEDETPVEILPYHGCQIRMDHLEKCLSEAVPLKPQRLMRELSLLMRGEPRVLVDTGNSWAWATHYLHMTSFRGTYRISTGFGAMGWAIGAAVGTALAVPDEFVICVTGDGSYLMSGQEITVAVAERLPVIFVILNDRALGMIKFGQRLGGAEAVGYAIPPVDFAMMAEACGARGFRIRSADDLRALDFEALAAERRPCVLDVHIDPEEIPPMGARVKSLKVKTPGQ